MSYHLSKGKQVNIPVLGRGSNFFCESDSRLKYKNGNINVITQRCVSERSEKSFLFFLTTFSFSC